MIESYRQETRFYPKAKKCAQDSRRGTMTLNQLNYVITIAEQGSINKAAQQLYISQPSLTSAVRELEKELGIVLFHRSGKGVTLTNDGAEFLLYARQLYGQYEEILDKYGKNGSLKKKFGVSAQHYSFAVKAFVDMAKQFDMSKYEFAMRETRTAEVIRGDVSTMKSEIGVLYLSDFNRKSLESFSGLQDWSSILWHSARAYVYLWKGHPLAGQPPFPLISWQSIPAWLLSRGITVPFIWRKKYCPPMNIPRSSGQMTELLC